jgi:hypothetical protein
MPGVRIGTDSRLVTDGRGGAAVAPQLHLDPDAVLDVSRHAAALAIAAVHLRDYAADDLPTAGSFGVLGERAGTVCAGLARRLAESVAAAPGVLDELAAALEATAEQARRADSDARAALQRGGG